MTDLTREFCAENVELVPAAIAAGARRIELCDNLAKGGTSPSLGVIRGAVRCCAGRGVDVMAMVRPRGGNFAYTDDELLMMEDDIDCALYAGATGVVFGCARGGELDRDATLRLITRVREAEKRRGVPAQITFHMAFDEIAPQRQLEAIDWLAEQGVTRILTHGGVAGTRIEDNVACLREFVARADGRITILPGAGITWENAEAIAGTVGVSEVHGTRIVRL